MSQAAPVQSYPTTRAIETVAAKPPPRVVPILVGPHVGIRAGSVLLKRDAVLPLSVQLDVNSVGKWNLVANEDAPALTRRLAQAGWNFLFIVPAVESAAIGFDLQKTLMKAVSRIVREVEAKGFNAAEIVSINKKQFFGACRVSIKAHPRHTRNSPYITDLDPYHYPAGLGNFTRIFTIRNRKAPQYKAM